MVALNTAPLTIWRAEFWQSRWQRHLEKGNEEKAYLEDEYRQVIFKLGQTAAPLGLALAKGEAIQAELTALAAEEARLETEMAALNEALSRHEQKEKQLRVSFSARIAVLSIQKRNSLTRLGKLEPQREAAMKALRTALSRQQELQVRLRGVHHQFGEDEPSESPANLAAQAADAAKALYDLEQRLPSLRAEARRLKLAESFFQTKVEQCQRQIAGLETALERALAPVISQIEDRLTQKQSYEAEIYDLTQQQNAKLANLGEIVAQAHPAAPTLQPLYQRLDDLSTQMNHLDQTQARRTEQLQRASQSLVYRIYLSLKEVVASP